MNVTVRNVITSMRLISWFDWAEFVESVSLVDEVLAGTKRVRRDGLRDPGSLPARHRGAGPGLRPDRDRGRPAGRGDGGRRAAGRRRRAVRGALDARSRLLPDLRRPPRARAGARRPRAAGAAGCGAPTSGPPRAATSGRSRSSRRSSSPCRSLLSAVVEAPRAPASSSSRSSRSSRPPTSRSRSSTGWSPTCWARGRCPGSSSSDGVPSRLRTLVVVPTLLTSEADVEAQVERPRGPLPRRTATATFGSPCCRTGSTPRPSTSPATTSSSRRRRRPSTGSTSATARRPGAAPGSCSSTGGGAGTRPRAAGWAGSASAASSTS